MEHANDKTILDEKCTITATVNRTAKRIDWLIWLIDWLIDCLVCYGTLTWDKSSCAILPGRETASKMSVDDSQLGTIYYTEHLSLHDKQQTLTCKLQRPSTVMRYTCLTRHATTNYVIMYVMWQITRILCIYRDEPVPWCRAIPTIHCWIHPDSRRAIRLFSSHWRENSRSSSRKTPNVV